MLQGNFCSYALTRIVNPAQDIFSVVCFVYIFQRINRSFLLLLDFAADVYRETYAKVCEEDLAKEGKKKRRIKALKLTSEKNPKVKIRKRVKLHESQKPRSTKTKIMKGRKSITRKS